MWWGGARLGNVMKMREIIRERDEASATALELAQMLVKFCEAVELDDEETTIARCCTRL